MTALAPAWSFLYVHPIQKNKYLYTGHPPVIQAGSSDGRNSDARTVSDLV
jgi:hypothetical protein